MWLILAAISFLALFLYLLGMGLTPDSKAFMLMERFFLGLGILFIYNFIGQFLGMGIGINPITCLIAGLLGVPGLGLMMVIQLMP